MLVNFVPSITAETTLPFGISCATFSLSPYSELAGADSGGVLCPVELPRRGCFVCVLDARGHAAVLQLSEQNHGLDRTAVPRIPALKVVVANVSGFEDV